MDMEERQEFEMLSKRDREERQDTGAGNSLQRGMAIDIRRLITPIRYIFTPNSTILIITFSL